MIHEQPDPVPNESAPIWDLVIADMKERSRIGRERYGTPLQAGNGRDALEDAYAEMLDAAVYLKTAIVERDIARRKLALDSSTHVDYNAVSRGGRICTRATSGKTCPAPDRRATSANAAAPTLTPDGARSLAKSARRKRAAMEKSSVRSHHHGGPHDRPRTATTDRVG